MIQRQDIRGNIMYIWNEYSPDEMPDYWKKEDRYVNDAKKMDNGCVVIECNENDAKEAAAYFVNNLFAIPTCTYYDGVKLSLCCTYAGRNWGELLNKTQEYINKRFK